MFQVLFRIPIALPGLPDGIPVHGYGLMLFVAFIACMWLGGRRALREGISRERIQDIGIWLFFGGLIGSRVTFMYHYPPPGGWKPGEFLWQFPRIWEGGVILFGAVLGGLLAYVLVYLLLVRKLGLSTWKIADVAAPCVALGIAVGRIGCLLNGCCYGEVCPECAWAVRFPILAAPEPSVDRKTGEYRGYYRWVGEGVTTITGFTMAHEQEKDRRTVSAVEPGSPAAQAGLRAGDTILEADGKPMQDYREFSSYLLTRPWPRGKTDLALTVDRPDVGRVELPAFVPRSMRLHPTQLYESVSMVLLLLVLLAYYPFRRRDGEVMALLMIGYSAHRYLNEMLRSDVRPEGFEKYVSILLFAAGVAMFVWLRFRPAQSPAAAPRAVPGPSR